MADSKTARAADPDAMFLGLEDQAAPVAAGHHPSFRSVSANEQSRIKIIVIIIALFDLHKGSKNIMPDRLIIIINGIIRIN